jgi:hypothetical protein
MTLEIISLGTNVAMLSQTNIWEDISTFLHLLLDPILIALQDVGLRRTVLSTIIWSFLIVCGLVFVVYELPVLMKFLTGPSTQTITKQRRVATIAKTKAAAASESRHKISEEKARLEREKREKALRETGVRVASRISKEHESIHLVVSVKNGGTSHIDMVVVDLDLPQGIDADIGSFRMQRLGTINAGESKDALFILRPMGGNPSEIRGHVEFLGASYEVSKIPIPVPEFEEAISNE